jgi:LPXTG-motif cell wall-anchored protein
MKHILAILLFAVTLAAIAHGDDDHGAAPPMLNQSAAPRATGATDEFEVVAVLDGKKLTIYLDKFSSNAPVTEAKLEVEGAGLKGIATESAPGVYTISAPGIAPGKHALTFSIESGEVLDLLSANLDTSLPAGNAAATGTTNSRLIAIIAGLVILGAAALLIARRRKLAKGA